MSKKIKITHPETKGTGVCLEESLPAWLAAGWVLAEPETHELTAPPATVTLPKKKDLLQAKPVTTTVVNLNQESPGLDLEETI